jgi:hypothetical protein
VAKPPFSLLGVSTYEHESRSLDVPRYLLHTKSDVCDLAADSAGAGDAEYHDGFPLAGLPVSILRAGRNIGP